MKYIIILLAFCFVNCSSSGEEFKSTKDEAYWISMQEFTEFNPTKMKAVKRIYNDYEKEVWKKKQQLKKENKKLSAEDVQDMNKKKTSKLVRLLSYKGFRKIKDFQRSLRKKGQTEDTDETDGIDKTEAIEDTGE